MQFEYFDVSHEWRPCNPKMAGSGVIACRPQAGACEGRCKDCYFSGGRYYEDIFSPHIPEPIWASDNHYIVRMNDGNDSNHLREVVLRTARKYHRVFFNTRLPRLDFEGLGPVVLTVNGEYTDVSSLFVLDDIGNLMAVRFRLNTWNVELCKYVIDYYGKLNVPVLLTFMAYYKETVRKPEDYAWQKRTLNEYWKIKPEARIKLEEDLGIDGEKVLTCTTRESSYCRDCGNCKRLFEWWKDRNEKVSSAT